MVQNALDEIGALDPLKRVLAAQYAFFTLSEIKALISSSPRIRPLGRNSARF
jgi:hypothetical protein